MAAAASGRTRARVRAPFDGIGQREHSDGATHLMAKR